MGSRTIFLAGIWAFAIVVSIGILWGMKLTPDDAIFGVVFVLLLSSALSWGVVRTIPEESRGPSQLTRKLEEIEKRLGGIEEKVEKIEKFIEE
ncbi:hypothetical protein [Thermococcus sp. 9N3]|uniref:hypothetical protein n=1 Tax=Thermococcus sp. 9N3 TaxID=163002 RepID=UPI001431AF58|nr:hypothetical protein [Thermococcus sp. 9N3]NJE48017.1 hypothetical protein [Thermococcus sp. 9N3]